MCVYLFEPFQCVLYTRHNILIKSDMFLIPILLFRAAVIFFKCSIGKNRFVFLKTYREYASDTILPQIPIGIVEIEWFVANKTVKTSFFSFPSAFLSYNIILRGAFASIVDIPRVSGPKRSRPQQQYSSDSSSSRSRNKKHVFRKKKKE